MKPLISIIEPAVRLSLSAVWLGLAIFCAFGFAASYEPGINGLLWPPGYVMIGCSALAGALFLLIRRNRPPSRTSVKTGKAIIACAGLILPHACAFGSDLKPSDLQGTWNLVYQESGGEKLPNEKDAAIFHGKMIFQGSEVRYRVELPGFDFKFSYVLHSDPQPAGIDLKLVQTPDGKGVGQRMLGICKLDGDTLEICYNATNRPADFVAGQNSDNVLIVLKKAPSSK